MKGNLAIFAGHFMQNVLRLDATKVVSSVGYNDKFRNTTFWFLWNIKHHNHATFMNQKVVTQNFIIEPPGDK